MRPADDDAFEAFVRANGTTLIRLAGAFTGDPHVSEELAQTALERVYVRWHRLNDPMPYARQIVVKLCRDRGRWARSPRTRGTTRHRPGRARCYRRVIRHDFISELRIPAPDPVENYVRSMISVQNQPDPDAIAVAVASRFPAGGGPMHVHVHTGCLVCT